MPACSFVNPMTLPWNRTRQDARPAPHAAWKGRKDLLVEHWSPQNLIRTNVSPRPFVP
jgi:hypothetical protein